MGIFFLSLFLSLTSCYGDKRQPFDFYLGMGEKDSCGDPTALSFQAVSQSSWLLEGPAYSVCVVSSMSAWAWSFEKVVRASSSFGGPRSRLVSSGQTL